MIGKGKGGGRKIYKEGMSEREEGRWKREGGRGRGKRREDGRGKEEEGKQTRKG